jgi:hypothetical protein
MIAGRTALVWARLAGVDPQLSSTGKAMPSGRGVEVPVGGIHEAVLNPNPHDSFNLRRWGVDWVGPDFKLPVGWRSKLAAKQTISAIKAKSDFGQIARIVSHEPVDGPWAGQWRTGLMELDPDLIADHLEESGYIPVELPNALRFFGERKTPGRFLVELYVRPDITFPVQRSAAELELELDPRKPRIAHPRGHTDTRTSRSSKR